MGFISALGFGLAAVWLVSSYLGWKHRMLALLGILLGLGVVSFLVCLVTQDMGREMLQVGSFSGGERRRDFRCADAGRAGLPGPLRVAAADLVAVGSAGCALAAGDRAVLLGCDDLKPGDVPLGALFAIVGAAVGITFGVMLPFLVLSFVNGFYRERLKGLLHLGGAAAPPMITPPLPAVPEAAGG